MKKRLDDPNDQNETLKSEKLRIQLETRCQNLETRNYELEAIVRTMKKG
jgi:hypothetical protein